MLVISLERENVVFRPIKSMHGDDTSQKQHHRFTLDTCLTLLRISQYISYIGSKYQ